ncbi:Eco57I restriction-modification methylase domain-containing protein [Gelidibacter pelagius]|uniref:site-specific DNA-methyltransferase (adenine-specific) n=1 Tax=Gelidibacter pelagius TaxID=2819985 RepID=A0ABS3STM6_9FLAO|nr:TaqI-like C-terminal specificity domain-containing protein [Gelidibacter pelagius]MBO3099042.1 Eco57I restriction-modification methylase domain-containing protein [Gelidibacter pelagius]
MALFQASVLKSHLALLDDAIVDKAYKKYQNYFWNPTIQENIKSAKEEQYQATFLNELFVTVLGYTLFPNPNYNLTTEFKNEKNNRKADGAILKEGVAIGVIELKGTNTKDLESIRRQAFDYKANHKDCVYVITSNFEKLRFYVNDATEFEEFDLFTLTPERFKLLFLCLEIKNILSQTPLKIKEASVRVEEEITKAFYKDYSIFKRELYRDLVKRNAKTVKAKLSETNLLENHDYIVRLEKNVKLTLFQKSQKLIDRFLFIFFAEDRMLLPYNSTLQILNKWKDDWDFGDERPLYDLFKQYFHFLDTGRKGTQSRAEIYAYNGGLFKPDAILDALEIDNDLLYKYTSLLSNYDFESQIDVNILGHIFENSLNEIESVNAEIEGAEFDKQTSKRKKDGVFYTPKYITKYIVENTVGKLCEEKKIELDFHEEEYFKGRKNRNKTTVEKLVKILDDYREWLLQLTICDPACGSGAFLNQALDFLIKEHAYIDELKTKLLGGGLQFPDIENTILENNIYGVDLNEESVEIAKLSLWLRTAQPRRKLNDLSSNVKCGNSLIDDKKVAGSKAFKWEEEFPQVFRKKNLKAYHITTAVHDSRTSDRMVKYKVRERRDMGTNPYPKVVYFTDTDDLIVSKTVAGIVKEDGLRLLAYNICGDHIHLLLVCDINDIPRIMQKIKSVTSKILTKEHVVAVAREHAPLSKKKKPLWQQKYSPPKEITSERQLYNTINYIRNNRSKHQMPEHSEQLQSIIDGMTMPEAEAFKAEFTGGFDVVIGNPPYVRQELFKEIKPYLSTRYKCYNSTADLYTYFFEKSIKELIKPDGLYSIIVANKWMRANYGKELRVWLRNKNIIEIIDFKDLPVFADATAYPCIITVGGKNISEKFTGVEVDTLDFSSLDQYVNDYRKTVNKRFLSDEAWSLADEGVANIVSRLMEKFESLKQFIDGKMYVGLKTGLNDAFIVDQEFYEKLESSSKDYSKIVKPYGVGRDLSRYGKPSINKYIIAIPSKWTNKEGEFENENQAWQWFAANYPILTNHLKPFEKRAKKRSDQGNYWWELRACDYYNEFEKPKIVYPEIATEGRFTIDIENTYFDMTSFIIGSDSEELLGVLNSKLISFIFGEISSEIRGGFLRWKRQYVYNLPIPQKIEDSRLKSKVGHVIELIAKYDSTIHKFSSFFQSKITFCISSKKLENWHELSFGDFIKELNKAIKSTNRERAKESLEPIPELTKKDEFEWMELFEENKKKAQELQSQIDKTEKEIDQMVYELYGLTEEEIKIVENS